MRRLTNIPKNEIKQIRLEQYQQQDEQLKAFLSPSLSEQEFQNRRQNLRDYMLYSQGTVKSHEAELQHLATLSATDGQAYLLSHTERKLPVSAGRRLARYGENPKEQNHFNPSPFELIKDFYIGRLQRLFSRSKPPAPLNETLFRQRHQEIFEQDDRIYFSIDQFQHLNDTEQQVRSVLRQKGYEITDYKKGFATDAAGKQQYKIGKLLKGHKEADLFRDDNSRQDLYIILSRHPYDIGRASWGRRWTQSCLDPTHLETQHDTVKNLALRGGVICYVVDAKDLNINNPITRCNFFPFQSEHGEIILQNDPTIYGYATKFLGNIFSEIAEKLNADKKSARMHPFNDVYYNKGHRNAESEIFISQTCSAEEFLSLFNVTLYQDENGKTCAEGTIDFNQRHPHRIFGSTLPDLSFIEHFKGDILVQKKGLSQIQLPKHVEGSVDISSNPVGSLTDMPKTVTGNFNASDCGLTSFTGLPDKINGSCGLSSNHLSDFSTYNSLVLGSLNLGCNAFTSLQGCPDLKGGLSLFQNPLTTLKGCPEYINGGFCVMGCSGLASLEHGPKHVESSYDFRNCGLNSLKYIADYVGTDLLGATNNLTHFDYLPSHVGGAWDFSENQLTSCLNLPEQALGDVSFQNNPLASLEGFFQNVTGNVDLSQCQLSSAAGISSNIDGALNLSHNELETMAHLPTKVGRSLDLRYNKLADWDGFSCTTSSDAQILITGNDLLTYARFPWNIEAQFVPDDYCLPASKKEWLKASKTGPKASL